MPAPTRPTPVRTESTALSVPKGIVGVYTDLEVDALLAALPTGGGLQTVDLSAYATTAYVDGKLATVYTKAEVDAAIAAAVGSVPAVDLSAYAQVSDLVGFAKSNDPVQIIIADRLGLNSITFGEFTNPAALLAYGDAGDGSGDRFITVKRGGITEQLAYRSDLDAISAGGSGVTTHDGAPPQPAAPTPAALEAAFAGLADGLHYFKAAGALVAIARQPFQTTVVVNGSVRSVARIVKSEAGLPTPENPSTLLQSEADGRWMRLSSPEANADFGQPEVVDLFSLVTKAEVDAAIAGIVTGDLSQEQIDAIISQVGPVDLSAYAKSEDVYTKTEGDAKYATREATTLIVSQMQAVFDSIYTRPEADARYAKLDDAAQAITAGAFTIDANTLAVEDVGGVKRLVVKVGTKRFPIAYTTELSAGGGDLSAYAKLDDNAQAIVSGTVVAKAIGFGDSALPPVALTYTDTGEGYGPRLVFTEGLQSDYLVYKSDLDDILQGSAAVDTSSFATTATVSALDARVKTIEEKPAPYTKNEVDQRLANCVTVGSWASATAGANWAAGSSLSSRKIGSDMVQIDCSVTFGTALAANTWQDLGVLATAARPAKDMNLTAVAMDGAGVPQIVSVWAYATGRVAIRNYGSITSVRFNGIIAPR